jgi:S-adenosylmethionine hydrolase
VYLTVLHIRRHYFRVPLYLLENHPNENRLKLNVAKQTYKRTETRLQRQYKNQQGNMISNLRRNNPKKFYRKFRKRKQQNVHNITLEQLITYTTF